MLLFQQFPSTCLVCNFSLLLFICRYFVCVFYISPLFIAHSAGTQAAARWKQKTTATARIHRKFSGKKPKQKEQNKKMAKKKIRTHYRTFLNNKQTNRITYFNVTFEVVYYAQRINTRNQCTDERTQTHTHTDIRVHNNVWMGWMQWIFGYHNFPLFSEIVQCALLHAHNAYTVRGILYGQ